MNKNAYHFTSARLGFRNWTDHDLEPMSAINTDPRVMEFFPAVQSVTATQQFITRMQEQLHHNGFCYYAVDRLDTGEMIGFTGLSTKDFQADFTPCVDIGWRFSQAAWNQGFATEAARRCLQHAFQELNLQEIVSMAPEINVKSIAVMQKAGMAFAQTFEHPLLTDHDRLRTCVLYRIRKDQCPADEI